MAGNISRKTGRNKEYEDMIAKAIGSEEYAKLSRGYDLLGDIAIIDFGGSRKSERKIAAVLMELNKNIRTVLAKAGAVSGRYRIRKVRYVAGKRNFIATYRENGCTFVFDVRGVYFSNRLSFERSRLLGLVKGREKVVVMFAGVGPFAIEIAKRFPAAKVVAIELNRAGYNYMLKNIKANKLGNVDAVLGDVKKRANDYGNFADRVIMPLPMSSMDFLDEAFTVAKSGAVVHLYTIADVGRGAKQAFDTVKEHSGRMGYRARLICSRVVRPYSSKQAEVVLDYRIYKGHVMRRT
ncbi:MAG: class I SAM-dependent methyltransferase [Candidatus Micrarchaeaceae archaeon]